MKISHSGTAMVWLVTALYLAACGGGGTSPALTPVWTKQVGKSGAFTYGSSTSTDASGNIYVAGGTNGGLDGNILTGTTDFILIKYDVNGNRHYTKQMGAAGKSTFGASTATDASGNVYVAGGTNGGLDGNILTGITDFILIKYDVNGNRLYTKQMGAAGKSTYVYSTATDASGNVYVAGSTNGDLDSNTLTGTDDLFLTKYDSNGNRLYTKQMGAAGKSTYVYSTATDASGNVYVAGTTLGDLDGNTLMGTTDFFLTKYDVNGNRLYTKQMGVAGKSTFGYSTATDVSGNVYVTGYTSGGLDGNTLTGTADLFLTKYDNSGNKLYTKLLGVAGAGTSGRSTATDASGNVYITGFTMGGLDGNTLTGTDDLFLTKYDSNGNRLYTRQMGVAGKLTWGNSTATDPSGNVYVAGSTYGGLDGNSLKGVYDLFLVKYNSAGTKQ